MNQFLRYILFIGVLTIVLFEITLRLLGLVTDIPSAQTINGNKLFKPFQTGRYVRGGLKEVESRFVINNQGWNSNVDYKELDTSFTNIAIIGDSYIEGFHVTPDSSIGRLIEYNDSDLKVFEYGHSGGNSNDYSILLDSLSQLDFDYFFILLATGDLMENRTSFMNRKAVNDLSFTRKLYESSAILRYLNVQHKMNRNSSEIFKTKKDKSHSINSDSIANNRLISFVEGYLLNDNRVVVMYEKEKLSKEQEALIPLNQQLMINHIFQPTNFGFDTHWNLNGRKNVANTISSFIAAQDSIIITQ